MTMYCTDRTQDSEMVGVCKPETPREEPPTLQLSSAAWLPQNTNCLAYSEDSLYLGLGHARGLSVWCASSLSHVAEWLQDTLEITKIQMTRMAKDTYLLGTIDDMGVARVYAYHSESIHLLSVINIMEDVNQRSVCLTFELSEGGVYGAASMRCNGDVWLEVYHFPSEVWLKELEKEQSQKQVLSCLQLRGWLEQDRVLAIGETFLTPRKDENSSGNVDAKWSPIAVNKIKPPKTPKGPTLQDAEMVLSKADFLMHCLSLDVETSSYQREGRSFRVESEKTQIRNDRCCTYHFLLPCGLLSDGNTAKSSPAGLPVAVCVWWSGNHNLLQYSLQKTSKNKPDAEPTPDMLWPNAKEILCSAVSKCTCYIAVGLEGAMVCVWDRLFGSPLPIVLVSAADSAFVKAQFVNSGPDSADDSSQYTAEKVHLLLFCKSGAIHKVTTGRGTQSCAAQLTESPADSRDLPTAIASVPFLQSLMLMVHRNGKIFLQDVNNQNIVCSLIPPESHLISTPCNPVFAMSAMKSTLFIEGTPKSSCNATSEGGSQSQLFTFHFGESDITKKYVVSLRDPPQQAVSCVNLEESCNFYLKQRLLSVDGMNKSLTNSWKRLQETAALLQQKHRRAAAS